MQILGERIIDPHGVDGSGRGLSLLPLTTVFEPDKLVSTARLRFHEVPGPWRALSGVEFDGYDIRHGRTVPTANYDPNRATEVLPGNAGFVANNVLGIATHGLLEDSTALAAIFGVSPEKTLDSEIDRVADFTEKHLDMASIDQLVGIS
jgi:adenosylcobyric acid synthase